MPVAGPFYFAWCDSTDTTFGVAHHRMDEYIFSARRTLSEGEKPLLEIVIENPHVGILSPNRKFWAWFSWFNGSTIVPLFFGRVVAVPTSVFEETLTIQLVAWPLDYVKQVQRVAETLKYAPHYDPVFIDPAKRDDPNTILEAHAKFWDVDPVTLLVTANDIIEATDGNEDFTADDHFYDGMNMSISQPPLTAVMMDATVSWTQTARGHVDMGNKSFTSYSGDGIINEWPKPLQSFQNGWSVAYANAIDVKGIANALTASYGWAWTNTAKEHSDGDTLSVNISTTVPQITETLQQVLTMKAQSGVLDPYATDENGDPAPLNIPPHVEMTVAYLPLWRVNTSLVLRYDAARQRTERIIFMVQSDLQPTIVDPEVSQDSELITMSGADVGVPILNLLNWTTIAGTVISVGQIIFPDNPSLPGGRSAQIATVGGTAGTVEPVFSDVVGTPMTDGTVTWSSLGKALPTDAATDWTAVSNVPLGAIILPRQPFYTTWTAYTQAGRTQFPVVGTSVSQGQIVQASNGSFQVCTLSGTTRPTEPTNFSATWGVTTIDGSAQWKSLGTALPTGTTYFIATQAGVTGAEWLIPQFNNTLHANTTDGTVIWKSIGTGDIPAGGTPGNVTAAWFFPTDRGRRAVEYLIAVCRAKLLWRSRCVGLTYECSYLRGTTLTPRKTATLHDPRIAGGLALGKVKTVELIVDGGSGVATCRVTLASTVGFGNAVTEVPGDPAYVVAGYVVTGYQVHDGVIVVLPTLTDIGYSPPIATHTDDGFVFPLTREQIIISEATHGTLTEQRTGILSAFRSMAEAAKITQNPPPQTVDQSVLQQTQIALANANSIALNLQRTAIWYDLQIKPVNAGPFNAVYNITCTRLAVPQMIDLQSETTT